MLTLLGVLLGFVLGVAFSWWMESRYWHHRKRLMIDMGYYLDQKVTR